MQMGAKEQTKRRVQAEQLGISRVLRRNSLQIMAFGYVAGRSKCENIPWPDAIEEFKRHFNLDESDVSTDTLVRNLYRMTEDFIMDGV